MAPKNYAPKRRARPVSIDECFARFTNYAGEIASTLAAHNSRLDSQDTVATRLSEDIRDLRRQQASDTATLHSRIDGVREELTKRLDEQTEKLTETITGGLEKVGSARASDQKRIRGLENWRWLVVGGGAVVAIILFDVLIRIFYQPIAQFFLRNVK